MSADEGERTASEVCVGVLGQGLDLVRSISDEAYSEASSSGLGSRPGAHLRHLIDYFDCLFASVDARRIDFTERKRRIEVEVSRSAGERELERCLAALQSIAKVDASLGVEVRADAHEPFFHSTLGRELSFVAGHAVHHLAMMRLTLRESGFAVPDDVGVSASTLAHWQTRSTE